MKNRAKCRLCNDILESFHRYDFVSCKCGEISIDGGSDHLHCSAKDWQNFMRIDDEGNEIIVKVIEKDHLHDITKKEEPHSFTRQEQIEMLETMIKNIENLPSSAMNSPINHYDFCSYLLVILSIFKTPDKN